MVSSLNLAYLNLGIEEIFGGTEWFGSMNVVFVGDLLQLPPVKGAHMFEPINNKTIQSKSGLHDLDQYLARDDRIRQADDQRKVKERQKLLQTFEQNSLWI